MTLVLALAVVLYLALTGTEPTPRELLAVAVLMVAGVVTDLRSAERR